MTNITVDFSGRIWGPASVHFLSTVWSSLGTNTSLPHLPKLLQISVHFAWSQLTNWNNYHCALLGKNEEQHSQRDCLLMVYSETGTGEGLNHGLGLGPRPDHPLVCAAGHVQWPVFDVKGKLNCLLLTLESDHPCVTIFTINLLCNIGQELHQCYCVLEKVALAQHLPHWAPQCGRTLWFFFHTEYCHLPRGAVAQW